MLAAAGYRVIVPYVRGYGTTRFLSSDTFRNGQQSAVAVDIIALMDALKIEKAILAGFDWGARTANIVAALWPERCKAMVSVSGYLIGSQEAGKMPAAAEGRAPMVVSILLRHRTRPGRLREEPARLREAHLADCLAESGTSTMRRSIAAQRPSTIRIMSPSSSTIIAGGSPWLKANRNMTIWKSGLPQARSSPCPPSPWKAMPMVHRTGPECLRQQVLRQIFTPDHHGRHRTQSATGSTAGLCPGGGRRRRPLIGISLVMPAVIGSIFSDQLRVVLLIAWSAGIAACAVGLTASYALDLPTGAAMVASQAGCLVLAGVAKALLFVGVGERRRNLCIAIDALATTLLISLLVSSAWLMIVPTGDQPILALVESATGIGPTRFLGAGERDAYESAARDAVRFQGEVDRLNALEKAARYQGTPLSDDEVRRIASYQKTFNEMTRGERFVQEILRGKAQTRARWIIGVPGMLVALTGLLLLTRRPTGSRRSSASGM